MVEIEHSDAFLCTLDEILLNVNDIYLIKKNYNKPFVRIESSEIEKSKVYKFKELLKTKEYIEIKNYDLSSSCLGCGYEHYSAILRSEERRVGNEYIYS